jgi:DNA modification methylase
MSECPPRLKRHLPAPYYDEDGITIYCADCRDVVPGLGTFDLLLTDPPYGIGESKGKNKSRGNMAVAKDYGNDAWDKKHRIEHASRNRATSHLYFLKNRKSARPYKPRKVWA